MFKGVVLLSIGFFFCMHSQAQVESCDASLTFVANEGVLIEASGTKILIDGLHRKYRRDYSYLPDSLEDKLENAVAPFDGISTVLVSHVHGDHFEAHAVRRFLERNNQARLISSQQVADSIRAAGSTASVTEVTYGEPESFMLATDVELKIAALPHSSSRFQWIQNLGHRIDFPGFSVLHVGDADTNERNFVESTLVNEPVDVAILPYWYLVSSDGRQLIDNIIRPGRLIAAHVSPDDVEAVRREVAQHYPDATVFGEMLKTRVQIKQKCPDE